MRQSQKLQSELVSHRPVLAFSQPFKPTCTQSVTVLFYILQSVHFPPFNVHCTSRFTFSEYNFMLNVQYLIQDIKMLHLHHKIFPAVDLIVKCDGFPLFPSLPPK